MDLNKLKELRAKRFRDNNIKDQIIKEDKVQITYNEDELAFNVYLTDVITGPEDYTNVFDTLINAREDETIRFILATPGGRLDTTNKIRGLAQLTKARTIAIVGDVASAGTILALSFDDIIVMPNIEFMIHNFSGAAYGKGHEIYAHAAFMQKEMPKVFKDFYDEFLTAEEIDLVIAGQDLYLNAEEVEERWAKVLTHRDELMAEANREAQANQNATFISILEDQGYKVIDNKAEVKPTVKPTKKKPIKVSIEEYKVKDKEF